MRKVKQVKAFKAQAATAYRRGKRKEAYELWQKAADLRRELQDKHKK